MEFHKYLNMFRGAYKVLEEDWQRSAREIGLTLAEQHTLWIIQIEGKATMSRVAEVGLWDLSTVMQMMKRLKEKGLVQTSKNEEDLRVSYVVLTTLGEEKVEASKGFTHRLENFLDNCEANEEDLTYIYEFLRRINQTYHGDGFINWVESGAENGSSE
ncbi:MarR family winged helix-turn-helix transcriptional regulator [Salsuginibacillus halophilus]|nr:MarR family transcriptional regulator [Salsuginibacillus halophilus]